MQGSGMGMRHDGEVSLGKKMEDPENAVFLRARIICEESEDVWRWEVDERGWLPADIMISEYGCFVLIITKSAAVQLHIWINTSVSASCNMVNGNEVQLKWQLIH